MREKNISFIVFIPWVKKLRQVKNSKRRNTVGLQEIHLQK